MERKNIPLQITILFIFGAGLITIYFFDFNLPKGLINAFVITIKPYLLIIGVLCYVPPLINLGLQIFSPKKEYDGVKYYKSLKTLVHLSFIIISIYLLAFLWVLSLLFVGSLLKNIQISIIMLTITLLVLIWIIDALCIKYFKRNWYNLKY